MGLDIRNTATEAASTIAAATATPSQLAPEKLPIDQPWRLTMSLSSANVTRKSVIAEQMYPIMMPATSSTAMWRIFRASARMNPTAISEPRNAAATIVHDDTVRKRSSAQIIVSATTIFAPDEMPSSNGPAIGLAKKVCSKNPDSDSAPPSTAPIAILGMRICQMMFACVGSPPRANRMRAISPTGIGTLPMLMFSTVIAPSTAIKAANTQANRAFGRAPPLIANASRQSSL